MDKYTHKKIAMRIKEITSRAQSFAVHTSIVEAGRILTKYAIRKAFKAPKSIKAVPAPKPLPTPIVTPQQQSKQMQQYHTHLANQLKAALSKPASKNIIKPVRTSEKGSVHQKN